MGVATSRVGNKVGVVYFTREEERQLMEGVRRFGRRWRHILSVYQFHHSRTSVSLKDKYRYVHHYDSSILFLHYIIPTTNATHSWWAKRAVHFLHVSHMVCGAPVWVTTLKKFRIRITSWARFCSPTLMRQEKCTIQIIVVMVWEMLYKPKLPDTLG